MIIIVIILIYIYIYTHVLYIVYTVILLSLSYEIMTESWIHAAGSTEWSTVPPVDPVDR